MGKDSAVAARNRVTAESSDEMSGSDGEAYSSTDEAKKGKGKVRTSDLPVRLTILTLALVGEEAQACH